MGSIRVLVVEDSLTVRQHLVRVLAAEEDIEVVGEAADGETALALCRALAPDVMTLDLQLPSMNGLEVTEQIMAERATRILLVSGAENRNEQLEVCAVLASGAIDALEKPTLGGGGDAWDRELVKAVRRVARVAPIRHPRARLSPTSPPWGLPAAAPYGGRERPRALLLGASTGGPGAVRAVLSGLPRDFPLPVLVVIHMGTAFGEALAEWLDDTVPHPVALARHGEELPPRGKCVVRVATPDRHLLVAEGRLVLDSGPERHSCRPSVDALFYSAATALGATSIACLLSGMGRDGAEGLLAIRRAGGATIAQDEASSVIYGMPAEAARISAAQHILPLEAIAPTVVHLVHADRVAREKP